MLIQLYTIYDRIAEDAGPIFCAKNDGVANRQYQHLLNEYQTDPLHFKLHRLGSFNTSTMIITSLDTPVEVVREVKNVKTEA